MSPRGRRDHGEGTVFEESARKRFVGQIDLGLDDQGRRIRPKVVGRTRKEVLERLADLKKLHTDGVDVTQRAVTFREAVRLWLFLGLAADVTENTR
ncbi:MAG TPA: hypothetical protein PLS68_09595 [Actinotalea sp.]|nr:hypothetical protein [Actinotalea sp.]